LFPTDRRVVVVLRVGEIGKGTDLTETIFYSCLAYGTRSVGEVVTESIAFVCLVCASQRVQSREIVRRTGGKIDDLWLEKTLAMHTRISEHSAMWCGLTDGRMMGREILRRRKPPGPGRDIFSDRSVSPYTEKYTSVTRL